MNEQPPSSTPPRKLRPAMTDGQRRPMPRPAQREISQESRFIGYLVLGFGVLAVITVLILAFGGSDEPQSLQGQTKVQAPAPIKAQDLVADFSQSAQSTPTPAPQSDLYFKRDKDLDRGDMQGDWQTNIGRYTAVLQIRKDVYQLILASDDPAAPRLYSSGTFQVFEDIVMLNPRMDWPAPATAKGRSIAYDKLTRASFPVIARFEGGKMLWQNVPQEEKRVVAPYTSPIFMSEDVKVATWKKM